MEGSCRTPIAALAELDVLTLTSRVALPDGSEMHEDRRSGPRAGAERLGTEAGEDLRCRIGCEEFETGLFQKARMEQAPHRCGFREG